MNQIGTNVFVTRAVGCKERLSGALVIRDPIFGNDHPLRFSRRAFEGEGVRASYRCDKGCF
jgi:hypothetical protein